MEYEKHMKKVINTILLISIISYLMSLVLPVFNTNVTYLVESRVHEPHRTYLGYQVLIFGWASLYYGVISWYANVGYFVTLALIRSGRTMSIPVSMATLFIALSSLTKPTIEKSDGYNFYISSFNMGFYLWLAAIAMSFVAAVIQVGDIDSTANKVNSTDSQARN
jgi:hypothetical protein